MVLSKLINLNFNLKILINFTIIVILSLIVSFILFAWYPFVLYSFLYSFLILYFVLFLTYLINKILKNKISILNSLILFALRIAIFVIFFFVAIYLINFTILDTKGVELLMKPINIFIYLLSYSFYYLAILLVPIYEWIIFSFLKRKNYKNIRKDKLKNESI